jgi:hypothetical protein
MVGLGDGLGLLDFLTAGCLMSWKPLPRWAIFLLGVYLGGGVVTLSFQTWIRLHQCAGAGPCVISLGKGAVWSAIWPAYWPVYFAGYRRPGYPAAAACCGRCGPARTEATLRTAGRVLQPYLGNGRS